MARKSFIFSLFLVLTLIITQTPLGLIPAVAATNSISQALVNPGFEDGLTDWQITGQADSVSVISGSDLGFSTYSDMKVSSLSPWRGSKMLRLGTPKSISESQDAGITSITQSFTPASNTLKFAVRAFSWEFRGYDKIEIEIKDLSSPASTVTFNPDSGSTFNLTKASVDTTSTAMDIIPTGSKKGDYLATDWIRVRVSNLITNHTYSISYKVITTRNNSHATWAYFDNANTPPAASVSLNDTGPRTNDNVTAKATKLDAEGDPVSLTFVWKENGTPIKTFTTASDLVDTLDLSIPGNGDVGDNITVEVIPYDGFDTGRMVSADARVIDTPPVARFTIIPQQPWEGDIVQFTDLSTDDDMIADVSKDHIVSWLWRIHSLTTNETAYSNLRNPRMIPANQGKLDVTLTVTDSFGETGNTSVPLTIGNSPSIAELSIGNAPPAVNALNIDVLVGQDANLFGRFIDPGWKDTHSASWLIGSTQPAANLQEDNLALMDTGIVTGSQPSVMANQSGKLTVTDNSGDSGSDNFTINVVNDNPDRDESNNTVGEATTIPADSVHLSYIQTAGDIDVFRLVSANGSAIPVNSDVLVTLKGLPADYDLLLLSARPLSPEEAGLEMGGLEMGGLEMGGLEMGGLEMGGLEMGGLEMGGLEMGGLEMGGLEMGGLEMGAFRPAYQIGGLEMGGLEMGGLEMGGLEMGGLEMGGLEMGAYQAVNTQGSGAVQQYPLSQIGFNGLGTSQNSISGTDISLSELGISLDSLGNLPGQRVSVVGFSANRGLLNDVVLGNVDTANTTLYAVVVGPNGAFSVKPYYLQVEASSSLDLAKLLGDQGSYQPPVDKWDGNTTETIYDSGTTNTLFVTQKERIIGRYGQSEWQSLADNLTELAGLPNIAGKVISLPISIYKNWDLRGYSSNNTILTNYSDIDAANGVTSQIRDIIRQNSTNTTQYVVIVGSDDIVPFHRVADSTSIGNERQYLISSHIKLGSPIFYSLLNSFILTDDYYVDNIPTSWQGHMLYIPDIATSRLVEKPSEIRAAINAFIKSNGQLDPKTALVTGYDFFNDGAQAVIDTLISANINTQVLNSPTEWSADDLRALYLVQNWGIANINAHYTHYAAISAAGFSSDNLSDILSSANVSDAGTMLLNTIIFTMGCHAGLNVPDEAAPSAAELGKEIDPRIDFPQALDHSIYIASTGFGYGDDEGIGGTERLMGIFTDKLLQTSNSTVGKALINAKRNYLSSLSAMTAYDEKSSVQFTLYGLPQYAIGPVDFSPVTPPSTGKSLTLTLIDGNTTVTYPAFPVGQIDTPSGSYFTVNGDAQGTAGRPAQPRLVLPIPPGNPVHSVRVVNASSNDTPNFNPVITRPTNEWELNASEIQLLPPSYWPAELATVNSLTDNGGLEQTLVIVPGQFRPTGTDGVNVIGTERLYNSLTLELLRSDLSDYQGPTVSGIELSPTGDGMVNVAVTASDPSGIAQIMVLTVHDGQTTATPMEISGLPQSGQFVINIPYVDGDELNIQTIDGAGNIATSTGKGANIKPIAISTGDAVVNENSPVGLKASIPDFDKLTAPVYYSWDFGDGSFISGITADSNITVQHTYPDDNPSGTPFDAYTTTLKVTDSNGGIGTAKAIVTVFDVPATLTIISLSSPINENGTATLTGSFTYPGQHDTHTGQVNWGDGTESETLAIAEAAGSGTFTSSHRYLDDNPSGTASDNYTVTVTITDSDTLATTVTASVNVNNLPPSVNTVADQTIDEGAILFLNPVATFTDAGTLDTHNASINWGDSSVSTGSVAEKGGTGNVSASHTFADNGSYDATVNVTDDDLGAVSGAFKVTVNNVAPYAIVTSLNPASPEENQPVIITGTFKDPGILDTHEIVIDWGDGSTTNVSLSENMLTFSAGHAYLDNKPGDVPYTITTNVTDKDQGTGISISTVPVRNMPPAVGEIAVPADASSGRPVMFSAAIVDPGPRDTHTAVWDWGDNSSSAGTVVESGGQGTASGSHTYANPGSYVVKVTVTDKDGGVGQSTGIISINAWDPTGDTDFQDGDLIGGFITNNSTTMTIGLRVAGNISSQFQYRVFLNLDGASKQLKYNDGKITGLTSLKADVSGSLLVLTFNLSDIGKVSGNSIQWSAETQSGIPGAPKAGMVDDMPDSGMFTYLIK